MKDLKGQVVSKVVVFMILLFSFSCKRERSYDNVICSIVACNGLRISENPCTESKFKVDFTDSLIRTSLFCFNKDSIMISAKIKKSRDGCIYFFHFTKDNENSFLNLFLPYKGSSKFELPKQENNENKTIVAKRLSSEFIDVGGESILCNVFSVNNGETMDMKLGYKLYFTDKENFLIKIVSTFLTSENKPVPKETYSFEYKWIFRQF